MSKKHILILGCGSVGKRHAGNLSSLDCKISCFDPIKDRVDELAEEINVENSCTVLSEAFSSKDLDGVVVASPTAFHPSQTIQALEQGLPVLLEKPAAKSLAEAENVLQVSEKTGVPVLLGYTWRWWPPLARVRQLLDSGKVGRILHVQFHMSAHLADWHPWEPYQNFFMASKEQGGGALLDESHWIDLMLWFFGRPESLYGQVERNSGLEIATDDNVDLIVNYADGKRITIHLDLYGRPHEKFIRFIGDKGTIFWSADPNKISIATRMEQKWKQEEFNCDRNDMFMEVAREFLTVLDGEEVKTCSFRDGLQVMGLIEAIRKSQQEQKMIRFT
ncbi:MAG: Gfo/Idh/MocA family oxidoreductase [Deltaproteobacteria bacterium]|nr:Gfo/Idh/MocA family oxidoreductase [Deltaproteobacteria bacterium]